MSKLQQHGGTLLGVIIGLIIGLAIAVVVALVITKGSSPFVNKVGKVDKASESASGQIGDPNKPLYSKQDAAKEAAKEFAKETPAAGTETKAETGATDKPATVKADPAVPAKPAETRSSEDKLDKLVAQVEKAVDKASEKTAEKQPKTEAVEEKWTYYLQAGAFREQVDAENARAKLALLGYEANIVERNSDNGVLYRVRLGPYTQIEAMNKVRNKLSENGIDVAVARNQK